MNKEQYLSKLKKMLPEYESQEILVDFEEHFRTGMEEGKTEQEIIQSLGDPVDIAKEYGYVEDTANKTPAGNRVIALIGLIFFDIIIGIGVFFTLLGIWIALWSVVLSLVVSGLALLIGIVIGPGPWYLMLSGGIAVLALSVVLGIGMIYVTKYAFKGVLWYGRLHARIATGE